MISLHYTSHTKAYNTIYAACNIVEAIYSFTIWAHCMEQPSVFCVHFKRHLTLSRLPMQ